MALRKIEKVEGRGVFVPGNDIDTDRIIPARFMVCVTFEGLGQYAFYDERKNADGSDKKHPLTDARFKGASILLSGANFVCGSSREHAPQSLWHYGFRKFCRNFLWQLHDNRHSLRYGKLFRHRENRGVD